MGRGVRRRCRFCTVMVLSWQALAVYQDSHGGYDSQVHATMHLRGSRTIPGCLAHHRGAHAKDLGD